MSVQGFISNSEFKNDTLVFRFTDLFKLKKIPSTLDFWKEYLKAKSNKLKAAEKTATATEK